MRIYVAPVESRFVSPCWGVTVIGSSRVFIRNFSLGAVPCQHVAVAHGPHLLRLVWYSKRIPLGHRYMKGQRSPTRERLVNRPSSRYVHKGSDQQEPIGHTGGVTVDDEAVALDRVAVMRPTLMHVPRTAINHRGRTSCLAPIRR